MLDFLKVSARSTKRGFEVYPKFVIGKSNDLMIRGGDFYAIWNENKKLWSTDEQDVISLIDSELDKYVEEHKSRFDGHVNVMYMWDSDTGSIDRWHKYCQKQCRDSFHTLDDKLVFSNTDIKKRDYASKQLPYPLEEGSYDAYEELISTLYSPEERHKIEWAIGSIISGDSKKIQKFLVFYGAAGTGKSTVLNIIQQLFDGYYCVFDAKALGSNSNVFALEAFKTNPLVAIQHDGDLSKIEDNTRLNSLVSHELMTVNEKFKSTYSNRFKAFLFMGTNRPVKITDGRSGLLRRLIDVNPSGNKVDGRRYKTLVKQIAFELGAIAQHCLDIYEENPAAFDDYVPTSMMGASNDFYNYILEYFETFEREDGVTLKSAWAMYKDYVEDAKVPFPLSQRQFKEELKNYFKNFEERHYEVGSDGAGFRVRNWYWNFMPDRYESKTPEPKETKSWIELGQNKSVFDDICADCFAQYASSKETPQKKWEQVSTKLKDISTTELHYVRVPENHIVIDFDIKDKDGNKSLELNLKAAEKWPHTYAEVSKGGQGLHLHYIYGDDVSKLANAYDDNIEVKVFTGNSSLRRRLSLCNNLPVATINSGLPFRKEKRMVDGAKLKSEKGLRSMIERNLMKEFHPGTKPSIDFINDILTKAYENEEFTYDVSDMRNAVYAFAAGSTNHAEYCIKLVNNMPFKSKEVGEPLTYENNGIYFYDVEVYPNLFIIVYKAEGPDKEPIKLINPTPEEVENLCKLKLVGFNCRRYDNHILRARWLGYSNDQLFKLSQQIINGEKGALNAEAYGLSYADVYDFSSKKQSLKKFEIELGIHHQEMGIPWDEPVPEELWEQVADYCVNDVIATEATWNARKADFTARQILADVAGMTVNDTTNSLTQRIIFGKERKPQSEFNYRDMGDESQIVEDGYTDWFAKKYPEVDLTYTKFDALHRPVYPGYKFDAGKSSYRDVENVGEGGYNYSEPGMYGFVALLDVTSMHPSSIEDEKLFGDTYTERFSDIKQARVHIKHQDFEKAKTILDGKLAPYLNDPSEAKNLANALKIAINSVYGLTSAKFENPFRDPRNKDNIVAKRGALFMVNLRHVIQELGFTVVHVKTDSIKIADATPEIIQVVHDYGKLYGYGFEHEATYDRMCIVNKATYIAKYADEETCQKLYSYVPDDCQKHPHEWTATAAQFQNPFVFKTLFSGEEVTFDDYCTMIAADKGLLYLDFDENLPDVSEYEKEWKKAESDYSKGLINDVIFEKTCDELRPEIEKGHNYQFVGKVGNFCPVVDGANGGHLYAKRDDKYYAAAGTKGYRWLESEYVINLGLQDKVDISYYQKLADEAAGDIVVYGNFEWFISDEPYESPPFTGARMPSPIYLDEVPFN